MMGVANSLNWLVQEEMAIFVFKCIIQVEEIIEF